MSQAVRPCKMKVPLLYRKDGNKLVIHANLVSIYAIDGYFFNMEWHNLSSESSYMYLYGSSLLIEKMIYA